MAVRIPGLLCAASLLSISGLAPSQTARDYVITARQTGAIQFRDPATLAVLRTVKVDLSPNSTGVDDVLVDPSGRMLYIEGPEHTNPNRQSGCCWLYSIALPGLEANVVADVWGTNSRRRLVSAGPPLLMAISGAAMAATKVEGDRWQMSPDRRWWAGLRSGPSLDLYDARENRIVRSLTAKGGKAEWYLNGAWIRDHFYVYTTHDGSGWLWHVSPESSSFGEPVAVPGPAAVEGCGKDFRGLTGMSAVGERLVVHEPFGGTMDRRVQCDAVRGGAWIIDPASSQSGTRIAQQFYFWRLVPGTDGNSLYGLTAGDPLEESPSELILLDTRSGETLKRQPLEGRYWSLAVASLRSIPAEDRSLTLPVERIH